MNRVGEIGYNNFGTKMIIIKYIKSKEIYVEFQDEHKFIKKTSYDNFKIGNVKNPYDKKFFNIGYLGEGEYKTRINKIYTKEYGIWKAMLERCYSEENRYKNPTYKDCYVCEEWHNFQNFAKWYNENYYEVGEETMCIDKDILNKGNKIYSPETCIFVPNRINVLFVKSDKVRGNLPIGVGLSNRMKNPYRAYCHDGKNFIALGNYNTPLKAFNVYKIYKENLIKQVADEYKPYIPKKLYDAMYRYEVEITD